MGKHTLRRHWGTTTPCISDAQEKISREILTKVTTLQRTARADEGTNGSGLSHKTEFNDKRMEDNLSAKKKENNYSNKRGKNNKRVENKKETNPIRAQQISTVRSSACPRQPRLPEDAVEGDLRGHPIGRGRSCTLLSCPTGSLCTPRALEPSLRCAESHKYDNSRRPFHLQPSRCESPILSAVRKQQ